MMVSLSRVQWPDMLKAVPRSCSSKSAFSRYSDAKHFVGLILRDEPHLKGRERPEPYWCERCGGWHIGRRGKAR